jgi:osmoprotectant transport system permease protein
MGFFEFFLRYHERLFTLLLQHVEIVVLSLAVSICFALPIGYFLSRFKVAAGVVVGLFSAVYAIPSIAMFSFLLPATGLRMRTAVIAISIYAQYILLRSAIAGFRAVDPAVYEAVRAMGLNAAEVLWRVQLPLAAPALVSGVRVAAVASVGLATISATINSGGIGVLMFEGLGTYNMTKIVWGSLLAMFVSFLTNFLLSAVENRLARRARGEHVKRVVDLKAQPEASVPRLYRRRVSASGSRPPAGARRSPPTPAD